MGAFYRFIECCHQDIKPPLALKIHLKAT